MAILKCKMCGGTLELNESDKTAMCAYCGNRQTVPSVTDEVITNLFNRANNLRLKSEFDKAAEIYGKILNNDDKISEAHWGLVLCKYGIEYVEDPKTYRRIPTCHRTQYTSVLSDADYLAAIENADAVSRELYTAQAHEIAELQKSILAIVKDEKPFDVFICYKETDESGKRTVDSTLANDIYYQLTKEGLRVFYSAITLEDKLGVEYEPYIFAALNSAKVMLVIGTKPEYFEAVWVKNEWSRYLAIMKNDREKLLIPCYRDMDAYDLPEEFAHLQAQDMSKIGFINDLVRGIKKVTDNSVPKKRAVIKETVVSATAPTNTAPLLKRAFIFLEDGEWASADEYAEKVLDLDPECAEGYLVKLMSELKVKARDDLKAVSKPFDNMGNYQKALRFGSQELKNELNGYISYINEQNRLREQREKQARLTEIYNKGVSQLRSAKTEEDFRKAAKTFDSIAYFQDSAQKKKICLEEAKKAKNDEIYNRACNVFSKSSCQLSDYENSILLFESIIDWRDSREKIEICRYKAEDAERAKIEDKKKNLLYKAKLALIVLGLAIAAFFILNIIDKPSEDGYVYNGNNIIDDTGISAVIQMQTKETVSAGCMHTVGLKSDGTVVAVGYNDDGQCDLSNWTDIVAVSAGYWHTVGLKADGTVVAVGDNYYNRCDVSDWADIVAISVSDYHSVGLKSDGTVVSTGPDYFDARNVSEWKKIVAISAGASHTVGLRSNRTVIATGDNFEGQCDVSEWTDIVAISAGFNHTLGLKSDGTVVATGNNKYRQCDVSEWTDIVAVSAGGWHTVGLKSDGTVVAVGDNDDGQCDVEGWTDIVAISAGGYYTIGIKSNGEVVAVGENNFGQCNVSSWSDIKLP